MEKETFNVGAHVWTMKSNSPTECEVVAVHDEEYTLVNMGVVHRYFKAPKSRCFRRKEELNRSM